MTDATLASGRAQPSYTPFSKGTKTTVLSLLLAVYTFNFIDRTIIGTIGPAIRADLGLTSAQLGLLGGLYFALLYTLLGVPIARIAERVSRVNIIAISLVVWSGFTALCGAASNFFWLAVCRFGVGVGEAGCSPPSHSLISDYYEPRQRATALSVYAFGIPLGTLFGAAAGGWLAQDLGWRWAFVALGLPGIVLALVFKLVVKEPPRGHADAVAKLALGQTPDPVPDRAPFSLRTELSELWAVTKILFAKWPVLHMVLGVTVCSFGGYGAGQFVPQYFLGAYDLDLKQVGLIVGLLAGVSNGIGTLVGGFVSDRLGQKDPIWYALTPAFGLAICVPIYVLGYSQPTWQSAALILLIPGIFHYTYLGPTFGVVQNSVETRRRATAVAIMFLFLNLIALGGGPPFTGWLIDHFADVAYANPALSQWWQAMPGWLNGGAAAEAFKTACPGGVAPPGAGEAAAQACRTALTDGTRSGIIWTVFFYGWASVHYFLAAIGMRKHMAERAALAGA